MLASIQLQKTSIQLPRPPVIVCCHKCFVECISDWSGDFHSVPVAVRHCSGIPRPFAYGLSHTFDNPHTGPANWPGNSSNCTNLHNEETTSYFVRKILFYWFSPSLGFHTIFSSSEYSSSSKAFPNLQRSYRRPAKYGMILLDNWIILN